MVSLAPHRSQRLRGSLAGMLPSVPHKSTAYLLMLFEGRFDGPALIDVHIYSEPTPTQSLLGSFFAEIAQADGASFSEAIENVIALVAVRPSMTWLRRHLRPEQQVIFDRKVEEQRRWLEQIERAEAFRTEFR